MISLQGCLQIIQQIDHKTKYAKFVACSIYESKHIIWTLILRCPVLSLSLHDLPCWHNHKILTTKNRKYPITSNVVIMLLQGKGKVTFAKHLKIIFIPTCMVCCWNINVTATSKLGHFWAAFANRQTGKLFYHQDSISAAASRSTKSLYPHFFTWYYIFHTNFCVSTTRKSKR